jgi:hypothetical protein
LWLTGDAIENATALLQKSALARKSSNYPGNNSVDCREEETLEGGV